MDHSYSTQRERLQKVDHCYFSIGKKTPKVVLRKAEVLKHSQKNNRMLIGEDHSYHKTNQLVNDYEDQSCAIEKECQENIADPHLTLKDNSMLKSPMKPNFALKVFKSKSGVNEKVIFYVSYFSQTGRSLRIKRTMKKCLKSIPQKVKTISDPLEKAKNCDEKHSDHSYFSKKYRRTKSLPVLFKNSEFSHLCTLTDNNINLSNSPPSSPPLSPFLAPLEPPPVAFNILSISDNNLKSISNTDCSNNNNRNIIVNINTTNGMLNDDNSDTKINSQHDHSYLKSPKKARKPEMH